MSTTAKTRRLMTGPYLARNPLVLAAMGVADGAGLLMPKRTAALPTDRPLNILVSNLAHLGDVIVMLPLLRRLRESPRTGRLGLMIGSWSKALLELGDFADEVHILDHWRMNRAPVSMRDKLRRHIETRKAAVAELRAQSYDVAIDAYAYFGNAADVLWSAAAPVRIGFTSGGGSTLYTQRIPFDPGRSILANQARLLEPILGEIPELSAAPPIRFRRDVAADAMADQLGRYVVFHVGPGLPHRDWPAQHWIALGRRLQADGYRLAFTGAPSEAKHIGVVREALNGDDLVGKFGLRGFATVLSRAQGLVAIDTMAGHLAAWFHTPTAVVFAGAVPPLLWRPQQPFARTVTLPVACAPCNRTRGCEAMTCIRDVTADMVYTTLTATMAERQKRVA